MSDNTATIGIKVDTKDIDRASASLENLAAKGAEVDKSVSAVEGAINRTGKSLDTLGKSGEQSATKLGDVGAKAGQVTEGLDAVDGAAKRGAMSVKAYVQSLFGMGDAAKKAAGSVGALAEKIKSAELGNLGGGLSSLTGGLGQVGAAAEQASGSFGLLSKASGVLAGAFAAIKVGDLISDMTMLAARYETMGVVMQVAGNNAGYTSKQMQEYADALQKSGISMLESRNAVTRLASAHIDLAKSQDLARAAQNLAVVANLNSSETLSRMVQALQSGNVAVLHSMDLNVNFEDSYKKLATSLGENTNQLTEHEKMQARVNAVLEAAAPYMGTYEASMGTAGKKMTSLTRYWEDFKLKAGEAFLPSLTEGVDAFSEALKASNDELKKAGQDGLIKSVGDALGTVLKYALLAVAALGYEVAYTFKGVGREMGGIAAQAAAIARLDFAGAANIRKQMNEDNATSAQARQKFMDKLGEAAFPMPGQNGQNSGMSEAERMRKSKEKQEDQERQAHLDKINASQKAFIAQYATNGEKLKAEKEKWAKELERPLTADEEKRIKDRFTHKGRTKASPGESLLRQDEDRLTKLKAEYAQLAANNGEVQKFTQSEGELAVVREHLAKGTDLQGKALTAATRAELENHQAKLTQAVALEKTNQSLKDEAAERQKSIQAAQNWQESIRQSNEDLQAQIDAHGKSKIAIEQNTLARMQAAVVMGGQIKVGKEWINVTEQMVADEEKHIDLMRNLEFQQWTDGIEKQIEAAKEQLQIDSQSLQLIGVNAQERARIVAQRKVELEYTKKLNDLQDKLRQKEITQAQYEEGRAELAKLRDIQNAADVSHAYVEETTKAADQINQALTDALMRGFEDGKGFAKNFRDTLKNMFNTLVLRPVISMAMQPVQGLINSAIGSLMGGGSAGSASGMLGMASNASSAMSILNGSMAGNMGALSGFASGGMSFANAAGSIYANSAAGLYGGSLDALLATNGAYGTAAGAGAASGMGSIAAAAGPAAALIGFVYAGAKIIDMIAGADHDPHVSGVAYYTGAQDALAQVSAGSTAYNYATGDLPDREALLAKLSGYGLSLSGADKYNDQQLTAAIDQFSYAERGILTNTGIQRNPDGSYTYKEKIGREGDTRTTAMPDMSLDRLITGQYRTVGDYYRGAGYVDPQSEGYWWNTPWAQQGNQAAKYNAAMTEQMRALAGQLTEPLKAVARAAGTSADLKTILGYAASGTDQSWGEFGVYQDGSKLLDWNTDAGREGLAPKYFDSYGQFLGQVFTDAMTAMKGLDLPGWARTQVDAAQGQLAALKDDKDGTQAAQIYQQVTGAVAQTMTQIKALIDLMPGLAGVTQDSIYTIGEAMGGLPNLSSAWSGYLKDYYGEEERAALMRDQVMAQLAQYGLAMPGSRADYRKLVEAQDLATDEGQKAFEVLMQLQGAFADVTPAAQDAAGAMMSTADQIAALAALMRNQAGMTQDSIASLADAMGGLPNLSSAWSGYLKDYYGEEERAALMRDQVMAQLAQYGLAMPGSREDYRKLLESQDIGTEEGRAAVKQLLGLSDAFAQVTPAALTAAQALANLQTATDKAYQALTSAINTQLQAAQSLAQETRAIHDTAGQAARNLYGQQEASAAMLAGQGQDYIARALVAAQTTGSLPDNEELSQAIEAATGGLLADHYASGEDFSAAQLALAGQLDQLKDVAGGQMSAADRQVKLLQDQIDLYKKQYDLLRGTDDSVGAIAGYVKSFYDAMQAEERAKVKALVDTQTGATSTAPGGSSGAGGASFGGGGAASSTATSFDEAGNRLNFAGGYIDYNTGIRYYDDGSTDGKVQDAFNLDKWKRQALGEAVRVPGFASGGLYAGGVALVGENGPELVSMGPSRIFNNSQTRDILSGAGQDLTTLAAKLDVLIEAVQALAARIDRLEPHARRTADAVNGLQGAPIRVEIEPR